MHRKHKHDIITILAIFALCVSVYLSVAKALSIAVPCNITGGCETVLNSKYSNFWGVPLSTWGVVYFSLIIVSSLLANHYQKARTVLKVFLGAGAFGSLVFLFLQFFVIKALCQYCLVTDILTVVMFLWDLNIEHEKD